ncbi:MAG: hypothetical protein OP8BY_1136 [Candidatus Saccharicenans subterraneus]|uniref:Uncharacterized protein n=1 Tax=Candidatus Saccharicenans subterraneus TaxID=2508984 RepID=A0A3E2BK82_9BACT|nr:MAG: hypothetical protein OP8BY_1136 [Candidatus Saccharicenans subterraneum]
MKNFNPSFYPYCLSADFIIILIFFSAHFQRRLDADIQHKN